MSDHVNGRATLYHGTTSARIFCLVWQAPASCQQQRLGDIAERNAIIHCSVRVITLNSLRKQSYRIVDGRLRPRSLMSQLASLGIHRGLKPSLLRAKNHVAILTSLSHLLSRRRISLFGHAARIDDDTPANMALQLHINVSLNRPPDRTWRHPPGRPRNKWFDQLRSDSIRPAGGVLSTVDMVVQRRDGPRRLRAMIMMRMMIMSVIKPEVRVHKTSQCGQRRTESQPWLTRTKTW